MIRCLKRGFGLTLDVVKIPPTRVAPNEELDARWRLAVLVDVQERVKKRRLPGSLAAVPGNDVTKIMWRKAWSAYISKRTHSAFTHETGDRVPLIMPSLNTHPAQ